MKLVITFLLFFSVNTYALTNYLSGNQASKWLQRLYNRVESILNDGKTDVYLSGYAWHNRYTYSHERIKSYNEHSWGGGIGKGIYDEKGNWHSLYAVAFLDSHRNIQPMAGYVYYNMYPINDNLKFGLGASVFLTARPDINNNIPFPGALPWISMIYKNAGISATYIPGAKGAGNVLFIIGKYTFN